MNDMNVPAQLLDNSYNFDSHEIRSAVDDRGEVWFCAKDVCEALTIAWSNQTLRNMPQEWTCMIKVIMQSGSKEALFLSEPGVYRLIFRLIFRSNKPKAVDFANWVCEEVLPAIRKQGFFGTIDSKQRLAYSRQIVAVAEKLTFTKDALLHDLLKKELRNLCNLVGQSMPDISLIGEDYKQMRLPGVK